MDIVSRRVEWDIPYIDGRGGFTTFFDPTTLRRTASVRRGGPKVHPYFSVVNRDWRLIVGLVGSYGVFFRFEFYVGIPPMSAFSVFALGECVSGRESI